MALDRLRHQRTGHLHAVRSLDRGRSCLDWFLDAREGLALARSNPDSLRSHHLLPWADYPHVLLPEHVL